jgi:hypothetical protein
MHPDYAKDCVLNAEQQKTLADANRAMYAIQGLCSHPEFAALAKTIGDDKAAEIAVSVANMAKGVRRRAPTLNQTSAIAKALLKHFGTARVVAAAAFGQTEEQMFGTKGAGFGLPPEVEEDADLTARREAATQESAMQAQFLGLPELTGTPKQVAWAVTIRARMSAAAGPDAARLLKLKGAKTARFWIDNNRTPIATLIGE